MTRELVNSLHCKSQEQEREPTINRRYLYMYCLRPWTFKCFWFALKWLINVLEKGNFCKAPSIRTLEQGFAKFGYWSILNGWDITNNKNKMNVQCNAFLFNLYNTNGHQWSLFGPQINALLASSGPQASLYNICIRICCKYPLNFQKPYSKTKKNQTCYSSTIQVNYTFWEGRWNGKCRI